MAPGGRERATSGRPSRDKGAKGGKLVRKYRPFQSEGEADMAEQITKQEAVRRALEAMGRDATPSQMQPYIKDNFGIEMSTDHISTAKGIILRKKKAGKGRRAKRPAAQGAAREGEAKEVAGRKTLVQQKPAAARGGKEAGIPLNDILYVKGLVGRFGPDPLHTLIDAFAR
jgi:hypothetical protein